MGIAILPVQLHLTELLRVMLTRALQPVSLNMADTFILQGHGMGQVLMQLASTPQLLAGQITMRRYSMPATSASGRRDLRGNFMLMVQVVRDRKSTRLNSSHSSISYAVFCLKK